MIVVDTNFLILMFDPDAMPHIERGHDRVMHFIAELGRTREEIMIPAPVLAEIVAGRIERVEEITEILRGQRAFILQPFDQVIAIETGQLIRAARDRQGQQERPPGWKVAMKYDAMVAATARVRGARLLCTDDDGFGAYLDGSDVEIIRLGDLPLPPDPPQRQLDLG